MTVQFIFSSSLKKMDSLPVRGLAHLATDTTMVCVAPRWHATMASGHASWKWKERTYLILWPSWSGATCGRCSRSWRSLVRGDARHELPLMRKRAEQAWRMLWSGMLACTAARAVASSLVDLQHCHGGDGTTPHAHGVCGTGSRVSWCSFWCVLRTPSESDSTRLSHSLCTKTKRKNMSVLLILHGKEDRVRPDRLRPGSITHTHPEGCGFAGWVPKCEGGQSFFHSPAHCSFSLFLPGGFNRKYRMQFANSCGIFW